MQHDTKTGVFCANIERITESNEYYRNVIFTGANCQLVLMKLAPGRKIDREQHPATDQFFRVESGSIVVNIYEDRVDPIKTYKLMSGGAIIIPQGVYHEVINIGAQDAHLYTIYSGELHHKQGTKEQ